jgi:hypothetical protein
VSFAPRPVPLQGTGFILTKTQGRPLRSANPGLYSGTPLGCSAAKLKEAHTKDRKFEDVVKSVEQAIVLVPVH